MLLQHGADLRLFQLVARKQPYLLSACCCNMEQISDFSASCKEAALPPLTHSAVIVITFNVPAHTEQRQY